jgi:hypothetical protein
LQADLDESRAVWLIKPSTTALDVSLQLLNYFNGDSIYVPWQNKYAHCET